MSGALSNPPPLTAADFEKISRLARERFGLDLREGKEGLVAARLSRKIVEGGFRSFSDYHRHVVSDRSGSALTTLIDALTTNFTSFLREPAHFELLRESIGGEMREARPIRIWSVPCSSGEEPYTIAMALLDTGLLRPFEIQIVASDISTRVLRRAQEGIYEQDRIRDLPRTWRKRYLLKGTGARSGVFKIKPSVAGLVRFEHYNLIDPPPRRRFHFIFCRNVMIYFSQETQQRIVSHLAPCLEPGGYLLIGHSESLNGIRHALRYIRPAVYRSQETQ